MYLSNHVIIIVFLLKLLGSLPLTDSSLEITSNYCTFYGNPCKNGATCVPVTGGGFTCACTAGYIGDLCDFPFGNVTSLAKVLLRMNLIL